MKIILIGPMPFEGESLGGAKVAFKRTVELFENQYPGKCYIIDTSRRRTGLSLLGKLILDIQTIFGSLIELSKVILYADIVMLNMAAGGFIKTGWFFLLYSKLFKVKIVIRFFGGDIYNLINNMWQPLKYFQYWVIGKFDLVCLETKQLIDDLNNKYESLFWLPNTRDLPDPENTSPKKSLKKLLFLSHIRSEKGVLDILKASGNFPDDVIVHFYGSLGFDISKEIFFRFDKCQYQGKLDSEMIFKTMRQYDALILPTFYKGEGYPGVIIEALQLGLPVITTRWLTIPEIVRDGFNGILIPIKSPSAIAASVIKLSTDMEYFHQLSEGALESGDLFRSQYIFSKLFDQIEGG